MNETAFRQFYDKTATPLWRFIYQGCSNAHAADDILQESYIVFLQRVDAERSFHEWKAYLYRIAATRVANHFRTRGQQTDEIDESVAAYRAVNNDLRMDMASFLESLEERDRNLLWLAHVEGYDHVEIGKILGIKRTSVRVLLHRARGRLRKVIEARSVSGGIKR